MKRNVVRIDSEKCTGCGLCVRACEEGAIQMVGGKAALVREDFCDGLGACLPECPAGAISIEEREAVPFADPNASPEARGIPMAGAAPGTAHRGPGGPRRIAHGDGDSSKLSQWPIQLRLVPATAPYFDGCDLLVSADCCAYACGEFHESFIDGRTTVMGCPKLDPLDSWGKLSDILSLHDVRSVTVARMDVPCCSGIAVQAREAIRKSGKDVPLKVVTVHPDGSCTE